MNDSTFWALFIAVWAAVIVVVTVCTTIYWRHHNEQVVALINAGVSPIEAKCALEDDRGSNRTCLILAAKR